MLGDAFLDGVGCEGSENCTAAGQDAQCRTDDRTAQHRADHGLEVFLRRHQAADLGDQHRARALVFEIAQDFGDTEYAHRHRNEIQPIGIFTDAKSEAWRAAVDIRTDQTKQQAKHDHGQRLDDGTMGKRDG
ncbi:hypothetical protein D3C87_1392490 [compost metagenome]